MGITNIFSERQKALYESSGDIYVHEILPKELRTQIIYIWRETLGEITEYSSPQSTVQAVYKIIVTTLREEYGVFSLIPKNSYMQYQENYLKELEKFFIEENNVNKALDAVEITFRAIDTYTRDFHYLFRRNSDELATESIQKLNTRLKRHHVGYRFENGQIIKIDSTFTHQELIKPTLQLLQDPAFAGAQEEFFKAHDHYRKGDLKESINECLKSLESTIKSICRSRDWQYSEGANAKKLLDICFENMLIPKYLQSHFTGLRSSLESGVPTVRNKTSGHGQGQTITNVPTYIASSVINMTATAILLLAEANKDHNQ